MEKEPKEILPTTWAARAGVRTVDFLYYGALCWLLVHHLLPAVSAALRVR